MTKVISFDNNINEVVNQSQQILKAGGLVIAPSDTVYGLLVDATNEEAVKKLISFKSRPWGKPISVFVSDFGMLEKYVMVGTEKTHVSLHELLPGPFTIILPSKHKVSNLLESEKGTLGVRIPDYVLINRLINTFGKPVTATSANISGSPSHYSINTLLRELSDKKKKLIDLIIDAGTLPRNKPSTIVDLSESEIKILRKGDIVFSKEKKYKSESQNQTAKIAQYIFKKLLGQNITGPVVFIIEGELGVGKTVYVKGIGEMLGIENIISPTYVVSYEYDVNKFQIKKLIHFDLYNIQDKEEFKYLGIEKILTKGNILCFEWGEKAGEIMNILKRKGKIVYVKMKYVDEKRREIQVNF